MLRRVLRFVALLSMLVLAGLGGCSKGPVPVAEVEGIVTLDNKPLPEVRIMFFPDSLKENATSGPFSVGVSDDKGHYALKCEDGRAGAVIGSHKVAINDPRVVIPRAGRNDDVIAKVKIIASRVPDRYTLAATTPLSKEVKAGGKQDIPIELTTRGDVIRR